MLDEHVQCKEAIRACPAIYQPLIDKEFEIRVTVIGNQIWAGKIVAENVCVDWRYDSSQICHKVTYYELPSDIALKCIQLCEALNLEFGCIDLIYSKSGQFIFLEINEAGQFLWKELADSRLNLLDTFCRFLAASELSESALLNQPRISLKDYFETEEYELISGRIVTAKNAPSPFFHEET